MSKGKTATVSKVRFVYTGPEGVNLKGKRRLLAEVSPKLDQATVTGALDGLYGAMSAYAEGKTAADQATARIKRDGDLARAVADSLAAFAATLPAGTQDKTLYVPACKWARAHFGFAPTGSAFRMARARKRGGGKTAADKRTTEATKTGRRRVSKAKSITVDSVAHAITQAVADARQLVDGKLGNQTRLLKVLTSGCSELGDLAAIVNANLETDREAAATRRGRKTAAPADNREAPPLGEVIRKATPRKRTPRKVSKAS